MSCIQREIALKVKPREPCGVDAIQSIGVNTLEPEGIEYMSLDAEPLTPTLQSPPLGCTHFERFNWQVYFVYIG